MLKLGHERCLWAWYTFLIYEEAEYLKKQEGRILNTKIKHGYFTMSPYGFFESYAGVYVVYSSDNHEHLCGNFVFNSLAVRPAISLKPETLNSSKENEENLKNELIKMIYILKNNQISTSKWIEYQFKYNSLKSYTASVEIMVLIGILGESLINAKLSALDLIQIDGYNEWKNTTLEELNKSKKLIQVR